MRSEIEDVVDEWHAGVNEGDPQRATQVIGNRVVVMGPKGAGVITSAQFAEWVVRSGVRLVPRNSHLVSERLLVVEQEATWPGSTEASLVATVFRVAGRKVTACLRLPDLEAALELAHLCREMAATE